jgi:hypothetical protein
VADAAAPSAEEGEEEAREDCAWGSPPSGAASAGAPAATKMLAVSAQSTPSTPTERMNDRDL